MTRNVTSRTDSPLLGIRGSIRAPAYGGRAAARNTDLGAIDHVGW
jgi:hypothetical protein